jgi:hypothetical protein
MERRIEPDSPAQVARQVDEHKSDAINRALLRGRGIIADERRPRSHGGPGAALHAFEAPSRPRLAPATVEESESAVSTNDDE